MILIVDDKPENIFSLQKILELNNFRVDAAGSGEEALRKILKNTYALIILDVQMPVMDGFEVAEALSGYSKAKDIPIIFLSAVNTDKRFIKKGYTSGGMDYITKPVDADILLLKVKTFYRLYEQKKELQEIQKKLEAEIEIRKRAQQELDTKVEELHSTLESIPQIAFTINHNGALEFVNRQWYMYADRGSGFPDIQEEDQHVYDLWHRSLKSGEPLTTEVRIKNKVTHTYRHHLLKMIPIKREEAIIRWVGTFTDIHQQKKASEVLEQKVEERTKELKESNLNLETSNYELQQFASVASHDLKEPLRKISVFSSMMKERFLQQDYEGAGTFIERIIESSRRMSKQIDDLLDYSRLSAAAHYVPTNLNIIIQEILIDFEIIIKEKEAHFHIDTLPEVDAIPGQMRQMFQNLIANALKFSKKEVSPEITIAAERIAEKNFDSPPAAHGTFCRITIKDNGIGFDEKYAAKIFTLFQRLNAKEEYEGTGIGLAITKKIVEKHNGSISVKSKENEGAAFCIILPQKQPSK